MSLLFDILILGIIFLVNFFLLISFVAFFWSATSGAPFVPTGWKIARKMVEMAEIKPGEKVYDLGSGDGRLVFLAAKNGADATGIEISPFVYLWAKWIKRIGNHGGKLIRGNLWEIDVTHADVIFTYLFPEMMERFDTDIYPKLKSKTRIITHGFSLKSHKPEKEWKAGGMRGGRILVYVKGK